ncbi:MAG: hypothetical protein ACWA6U_11815 [Breznakibacter sp.]
MGLVAYAPIVREVVLVPVNQAQCPQNPGIIKTELEKLIKSISQNVFLSLSASKAAPPRL